ncbi:MAG: TonB-dependent receptor [Acidobacteria bacterium]|nr:TonB-dependent receptor [Acidobacteriota bacterium]
MVSRLFVSLLLTAFAAFAQSSAGGATLSGTVKDATGAVIPSAKVTIRHVATGVVTRTEANAGGFFATPPLNIGKYIIQVEAPGMKTWETEAQLETGRQFEVNAVLKPGSVSETIEVTASIPLVTTTDGTDGTTLDSMRITELPINGRDLNMLLQNVTPGVEMDDGVNGGLRVGGMMTYTTDYVQDGASSNNREFGGSMNIQGLDSIAEVRIETSTSSAKYTRPTSVIVTTKGGSNQIRITLFETIRNNGFGVARARQDVNYNGQPFQTPKLIRNEFGGTIGGPVVLPSFGLNGKRWYNGKGRTFFFFSREGQELRQGITSDFTVPTPAMRQGDFSGLIDSNGRFITLYDPLTTTRITAANGRNVSSRLPFTGNRIPVDRQSPLSKYIYGITPMPSDITNPLVTSNLRIATARSSYPNSSNNPTAVRLDHRFSQKDNLWMKANWSNRFTHFLPSSPGGAPTTGYETNWTVLPMDGISGSLSWNHVFNSGFFVETLVNRTWQLTQTVTGLDQRYWSQELGLPNPFGEVGFPAIRNVGFMQYTEGDNRRALYSMVTNLEQNYSLIRRTHNIAFGWRHHHEKQNLIPDQGDISGTAYFNSLATALESSTSGTTNAPGTQSLTGNDAANFFLGATARVDVGLKRKLLRVVDRNWGFYAQDNWRVNDRLTLTPGVRWDMNLALTEKDNLLNRFDLKSHSVMLPESLDYYYKRGATSPAVVAMLQRVGVTFQSAEELGQSKQIFPSNYFDIGPRMGFAYKAFSGRRQLIIRGGYGLYINALPMRTLLANFSSMVPFRATFSYSPNAAATSPDGIPNYLLRNVPTVYAGVNTANIVDFSSPNAVARGVGVIGMSPDQPSMKIHEWNIALEKMMRQNMVIRVRYNGKHGVNADQLYEINPQPNDYIYYTTTHQTKPTGAYANVALRPYDQTAYGSVRMQQKTGYINSSVMSFEFERRFTKGLGFQAFYTITNSFRLAGNSFRDDVGAVPAAYLPGAVPEDFDKLNRFLYYDRDTWAPKHRIRWNWNYDLPFGKGKWIGRNVPRWANNLVGGWKLSGSGTLLSQWFAMPTNQWGEMGRFEVYGRKYEILDCRSTPATAKLAQEERCRPGYLYHNGYISERFVNSYNANGLRNGVFGLPEDYKPAMKPVNPWPKGGRTGDPGSGDWDTNVVYIPLNNGTNQRVNVDTGLHPWRNQYVLGPFNWITDTSLLKFFQLTEKARLRMNMDVFNVFNNQGQVNPAADGIATLATSYGGNGFRPRQMQVTMRLEW